MKDDQKRWWHCWAPYWEHLEDKYLGVYEAQRILASIKEPVLVIGAGQGLVLGHLQDKGFDVTGVDIDEEMVRLAKARRGLDVLHADARDLPLPSGSFNTVIAATGVIDYVADDDLVKGIVNECRRVLSKQGNLMISFYHFPPRVEAAYRSIGVVTPDNVFRLARIFKITQRLSSPLACAGMVKRWTGRNFLASLYNWTKLGLTLPPEMKQEHKDIKKIVEIAKRDGVSQSELFANTPDEIPYRKAPEIEQLMEALNLKEAELLRGDECITVKCSNAGLSQMKAR